MSGNPSAEFRLEFLALAELARFGDCGPSLCPEPLPAASAVSIKARRRAAAMVLRIVRKRCRILRHKGHVGDGGGMLLAGHMAMIGMNAAWWKWSDDFAAGRVPYLQDRATRRRRRVELVARYLDGSLKEIIRGEWKPLPEIEFIHEAECLVEIHDLG